MSLGPDFFSIVYLCVLVLFILGLKGLSSPKTALRGNTLALVAMAIAIVTTLMNPEVKTYTWIFLGLGLGAIVGTALALKIQMTAMPQLVAALHSFVGLAATLIAFGTFLSHKEQGNLNTILMIELTLGAVIGAITFSGSVVAFGKLQELLGSAPVSFKGQHHLNLALGFTIVGVMGFAVFDFNSMSFFLCTALAMILGVLLIIPIGGADMPVVVSMLNSYSGWAASATGFSLGNNLLITTGALVGSSGAILSYIMCKAMNRSILNVVLGGFGGEVSVAAGANDKRKNVKSASAEDAAFILCNATKVIIVPGYGMAVSQAQHAVKELFEGLQKRGVDVRFAIHPVAGRMPGHMNVLLAESEIPYDVVFELDEINSEFSSTDVSFVIGANDVVNPDAKTNKSSPLYGMPILDVFKSKHIFVSKRSMNAGYAGVDNSLFYYDNCSLVFGDAKHTCDSIARAIRDFE